jgi:gamma-butyrobetaine dioxygenase
LLTQTPVTFHRIQKKFESIQRKPIIELDADGNFKMIRYSYFTLDPYKYDFEDMEDWYRAYNAFARLIRNEKYQYRLMLNPGDFLLYDNHRY